MTLMTLVKKIKITKYKDWCGSIWTRSRGKADVRHDSSIQFFHPLFQKVIMMVAVGVLGAVVAVVGSVT
jgi:hypothetical protein